ncbi:MAG TPA: hypothetical protein VHC72_06775, partial [Bryobacteraceae bacterium]|nr:hypothetical protein [Bryobacteraceae bacterium]
HPDLTAFDVRAQNGAEGVLYSALSDEQFGAALYEAIARRRRLRSDAGELSTGRIRIQDALPPLTVTQSGTRIAYGDKFILKLLRRLEPGVNPEVEVTQFLIEKAHFARVPAVAGTLEYRPEHGRASTTIGVLHTYVPHETTAWRYTIDSIGKYFEQVNLHPDQEPDRRAFGAYLDSVALLGQRTAELHIALAHDTLDARFAPEPYTDPYRLGMYHSLLNLLTRALDELRRRALDARQPRELRAVLAAVEDVSQRLRYLRSNRIEAMRIRIHGCYQLRQLLFTGRDFIVTDCEGDQRTHFAERRKKRSPLHDIATMLLSLRRAAATARTGGVPGVVASPENADFLDRWGEFWYAHVSKVFLDAYREAITPSGLTPKGEQYDRTLEILVTEAALASIEGSASQDWIVAELRFILDPRAATPASIPQPAPAAPPAGLVKTGPASSGPVVHV